jgi:hypothetical protein
MVEKHIPNPKRITNAHRFSKVQEFPKQIKQWKKEEIINFNLLPYIDNSKAQFKIQKLTLKFLTWLIYESLCNTNF